MTYRCLAAAVVVFGLLPGSVSAAPQKCTTCHSDKIAKPFVHGPVAVDACDTCHVPTGKAHPGTGSMKFTRSRGELCVYCHDLKNDRRAVHRGAAERCPSCHDPHTSADPLFLRSPVK